MRADEKWGVTCVPPCEVMTGFGGPCGTWLRGRYLTLLADAGRWRVLRPTLWWAGRKVRLTTCLQRRTRTPEQQAPTQAGTTQAGPRAFRAEDPLLVPALLVGLTPYWSALPLSPRETAASSTSGVPMSAPVLTDPRHAPVSDRSDSMNDLNRSRSPSA